MNSLTEELNAFSSLDEQQRKSRSNDGAGLLFRSWQEMETHDFASIAQHIMEFPFDVFESFCDKYIELYDPSDLRSFFDVLKANELFRKNLGNSAVLRGFIFFSVICRRSDTSELAQNVLKEVLKIAWKKGKLSQATGKIFKDYVWNLRGKAVLDLDYSSWSNADRQRMLICLTLASEFDGGLNIDISEWMKKYGVSLPEASKTSSQSKTESMAKEILQTLQRAREEASSLIAALSHENGTLQTLKQTIAAQDAKNRKLENEIRERNHLLDEKERHIEELNSRVNDLDERLKRAFQMDEISKNQELLLLKNELADKLKGAYADYMGNKDASYNEGNYEAFKIHLEQIFKTLKRAGISID